jgi:DNA-directed RNA polymerase specialized sigma24 family protein
MKHEPLTPDDFEKLLLWLNKDDREQAAGDYENIRRRLIRMFISRGCYEAEDVADHVIDRVIRKLDQLHDYVGPREPYFYKVGAFVLKEWLRNHDSRKHPRPPAPLPDPDWKEREQRHDCLDECMRKRLSQDQTLILEYYQQEKRAKIDSRQGLAEKHGMTLNALRIKAYRIRATLQDCVFECMKRNGYEIA